ncbi:MAG: alpha/beta hydrolase [Lachnospiraceae bacterium]|nr:alpha/beta hydrolase [Lachnospiraceae bacterium]
MSKNIKNNSVKIGNTEMYYASFGSGSRPLVILPGLSDGLATVKGKAMLLYHPYKKFLNDFTVYMFSRKNEMPEGYSIRDMARDQAEAMKKIGIEKAILMGVSQGGMVSQYIAIDYPEMIEALILVVTAPYANDVATGAVSSWIDMAEKGDHLSLMVDTAEKMYSDKYLEKNRKIFPVMARFTKPKDYTRFLRNANAILGFDARDELSKIFCPTLIISGDDDNTVGNDAPYEFEKAIPNNTLYIYKGLGHSLFEEAKDFYDRVLDFCLTYEQPADK